MQPAFCGKQFGTNYVWLAQSQLACLGMAATGCGGSKCGTLPINGQNLTVTNYNSNNTWNQKKSYGGASSNRDRDIKMGMCQNNAALIVAEMNPLEKGMSNEEIAEMIKDLKLSIFEANCA